MNTTSMPIASNRVADIRRYCCEELAPIYGENESATMIRMLFEAFLGWDLVRMLAAGDSTVNQSDLLRFYWAVEDLKRFRPIQHIIGYTDFCGCRIAVSPEVLIPRPETAEMVAFVLDEVRQWNANRLRVADLCTGSGCIAIAMASALPQAEVVAVDFSEPALSVAAGNAKANGVAVRFVHADVLDVASLRSCCDGMFDVIVSNPPYVREQERMDMQPNVLEYEPAMALFVSDDDPLCFYRAIAQFSAHSLSPKGLVAVETNESLGRETLRLFSSYGLQGQLEKDFLGKDRMIFCHRQ